MRIRIVLAIAVLFGLTSFAARAASECHIGVIVVAMGEAKEFPVWMKAGGSCRLNRSHRLGTGSVVTKAPDHGIFDLQENYWSYTPNAGFKGHDTFGYTMSLPPRNANVTIDMDLR